MNRHRTRFIAIILLGACLRLIFSLISNHVYHPDEVFQTLEPAHRLVFGYGIIPWDYQYGLRSFFIPYLLSIPLIFLKLTSLDSPLIYIPFIKILLTFSSLILLPAAYLITYDITKSPKTGLLGMYLCGIWYELIYFSPRALTEVFATYLFASAAILLLRKPKYPVILGAILGLAALIRIQYAILLPFFYYWYLIKYHHLPWIKLTVGICLSICILGLIDLYTYGTFLAHQINNLSISYFSGISELFGAKPWWFYLWCLLVTSGGLFITIITATKMNRAKPFFLVFVSILILHSLIPHKEYRFIFILIPFWLILSASCLSKLRTYSTHLSFINLGFLVSIFSLISIFGLFDRLPWQTLIFAQPPFMRDPVFDQLSAVSQTSSPCQIMLPDRDWVYSGGYYSMHLNIPFYTLDYTQTPATDSGLLILRNNLPPPTGFILLKKSDPYNFYLSGQNTVFPGYTLYIKKGICPNYPSYTYIRSFDYLNNKLKSFKSYQID